MDMKSYPFNDYLNKKHEIDKIIILARYRNKIKFTLSYLERLNRDDANYHIENLSIVLKTIQIEINKYLKQ